MESKTKTELQSDVLEAIKDYCSEERILGSDRAVFWRVTPIGNDRFAAIYIGTIANKKSFTWFTRFAHKYLKLRTK